MTRTLRFLEEARVLEDGRSLRDIVFVREPRVPISTVCRVANRVRDEFAAKLDDCVRVDCFEPVAVTANLLDRLLPGANVFVVTAEAGTFWLLLPAASVGNLVAAAFGEDEPLAPATLSQLEGRTLHRMITAIGELAEPLFGTVDDLAATHNYAPIYTGSTYFELRIAFARPVHIGIVLASDPSEKPGATFDTASFADIPLTVHVRAGSCEIPLSELGSLEIGKVLPMIGIESAQLVTGSVVLAQGTCGTAFGHNAFLVGTSGESTTS